MRDKGTGGLYFRNRDQMWVAALELPSPDGKRRRKVIVRKRQADAIRALREARKELDRTGDLPTASPTLEQWCALWLDRICRPRLKPRTLDDYRSVVGQYVVPSIGRVRLDKLTPAHVRRMHDYILDKGLTSTTALKAHRVLAKALTDAEREGRVTRNVATLLDAPKKAVSDRRALTATEAATLLRSCQDDPAVVHWALALLTGLRQGERLGLTRDAVDLDAGFITVSWQLQRLTWQHGCDGTCGRKRGGNCPQRRVDIPAGQEARHVAESYWLTRPKSKRGWRQIPLAPMAARVLHDWIAANEPWTEGLLFTRKVGDRTLPIDPTADSKAWREACVTAGVTSVPLHAARHTTATLLYELGVPENTRVAILGHSSATTTAGYTHVSDPLMIDAMGRLGALLALPASD